MTLGEAIRSVRRQAGMSQKELAAAVGIDQSYMSMIESDLRSNPGTRIMARLAQALQVSIDDLAALAGYLPQRGKPDPLADQAIRLFRRLPRWRQEDVVAQLQLYVHLTETAPRVIGQEGENAPADQTLAHDQGA